MESSLYTKLLELPLFQGLGMNDLNEIVGYMKLDFRIVKKGNYIVRDGDLCEGFIFLLNGELIAETVSPNHLYMLSEDVSGPTVLQPECIFGLRTRYTHSFFSKTRVQLLYLKKDIIVKKFLHYDVFRFNLLNIVSTCAQLSCQNHWQSHSRLLVKRFVRFVQYRSLRPAGRKSLRVKMEYLAKELLDTRLNISKMLHGLSDLGLLEIHRQEIWIPSFEKLIAYSTTIHDSFS